MTTQLAPKPPRDLSTSAPPATFGTGGAQLDGGDAQDLILPQAHLIQGLPAEKEMYGKHKDGALVDTLSRDELPSNRFIPVIGYVDYVRYKEPRGSGIEYKTRDKSQVPAADLEWDRTNNRPPLCSRRLNWIVIFEGMETPLVLCFKSTSVRAGQQINSLERLRGRRGPGLYVLESRPRSNNKGKWLDPQVRSVGDPPAEFLSQAKDVYNSLAGINVTIEEGFDDEAGDNGAGSADGAGDEIPL